MSEGASIVQRVLSFRHDYYRMLDVTKSSKEAEIKAAYKKKALLCHPDKNKSPKADEAFKLISEAYVTLSDPSKRRIYDQLGSEGVQSHERRQAASANGQQYANSAFFSHFMHSTGTGPEMGGIFNEMLRAMMNGNGWTHGGFRAGPFQPRQSRTAGGRREDAHPLWLLLPLLIFLFLSFFLQTGIQESRTYDTRSVPFRLNPAPKYRMTIKRTVERNSLKVPYYISPEMDNYIKRGKVGIAKMEEEVLKSHVAELGRNCTTALKNTRKEKIYKGSPSICEEYDKLYRLYGK